LQYQLLTHTCLPNNNNDNDDDDDDDNDDATLGSKHVCENN
jgi:hypothetical protein